MDDLKFARRDFLRAGIAVAASASLVGNASAKPAPGEKYTIGLLHYVHRDDKFISTKPVHEMKENLAQIGYVEGENVEFIEAYGDRDLEKTVDLARDMVDRKAQVICSFIGNANTAAKRATEKSATPVVCYSSFPLQEGLAESYLKPGKNFTGFSYGPYNNFAKVRALKIARPGLKKVGYLHNHTYGPAMHSLEEVQVAAQLLDLDLQVEEALEDGAVGPTLRKLIDDGCGGIVIAPHEMLNRNSVEIGKILIETKTPGGGNQSTIVHSGGLFQYTGNKKRGWDAMPKVVDRILKGESPAEIPFARDFKTIMYLNMKAAELIGVELPQYFQYEADVVLDKVG